MKRNRRSGNQHEETSQKLTFMMNDWVIFPSLLFSFLSFPSFFFSFPTFLIFTPNNLWLMIMLQTISLMWASRQEALIKITCKAKCDNEIILFMRNHTSFWKSNHNYLLTIHTIQKHTYLNYKWCYVYAHASEGCHCRLSNQK